MKKIGLVLAFLAMSLFAEKEVKFGTQDFAPYHYELNGKVEGPIVELINKVCQELKWKCSFESFPFARTEMLTKSGQFNSMFVIGKNKEREEWVDFSHPIVMAEYGLFVESSNQLNFTKPEDVKGYTVGVFGPSNTSKSLEGLKEQLGGALEIDMRPNDEDGFKKVSAKRINAVYSNKHVGNALITKLKLENIRYAGTHKPLTYYIGFAKESVNPANKGLAQEFNAAYKKLFESGEAKRILSGSFMEPVEIK